MKQFNDNIQSLYGYSGKRWLQHIPELLYTIAQRLTIKINEPFLPLTYNYVAPAVDSNGNPLIVKCAYPNDAIEYEIAALEFYAGEGAVDIIASDPHKGWLVIEACCPGLELATETHDDIATHNAVRVMQQLYKPISKKHPFKTVNEWLHGLQHLANAEQTVIENNMILNAQHIATELLDSMGESVLLHGDLHQHNILSATREPWLAIDPKGVVGEREYECGAYLRNPVATIETHENLQQLITRRIAIMSELTQFDKKRLLSWAFVQAVLAAWWHIEDNTQGAKLMQRFANACYQLITTAR